MRRILTHGGYFEAFVETLEEEVERKIDYGLQLLKTQERLSAKIVKHVGDGLYELRTEWDGNISESFSFSIMIMWSYYSTAFKRNRKEPHRTR